jgi:hypothetical protein
VGDRFIVGPVECELTGVEKVQLSQVATQFYWAEGFESPDAFKTAWCEMHPLRGYDSGQEVWIHFFKVVE